MQLFVKSFKKGLITRIEDKDQARGSASDMLNWHVMGDHIELRRGLSLLGTEQDGAGRVTGLRVGRRHDGIEIPFYTYGQRYAYIDPDTGETVSSQLLPADADGEDVSIEESNSLAGNILYLSSPNSSMYKIPVASPDSPVDLLMKEYRGKIRIKQSRSFLWDRMDDFGGSDKTGLYISWIDQTEGAYLFTSSEQLATGDGIDQDFAGTLAFKAAESRETCFFVVIAAAKAAGTGVSGITKATAAVVTSASHGRAVGDTVVFSGITGMTEMDGRIAVVTSVPDANTIVVNIDSTNFTTYVSGGFVIPAERFVDDRSGRLVGQDGGTGTINYATGVYTFSTAVAIPNALHAYAQYFRELSTTEGIADFTFSATREAGEGSSFRQDDGGGQFMNIESFGADEYCLHEFKTWLLTLGADDTQATNLIYRDGVGIPYFRASKATGDGIYYVDVLGDHPAIRILEYGRFLQNVVPRSISDQLDLSHYEFDQAVIDEWGDYIVVACRTEDETVNNRLLLYSKIWKSWEIHGFRVSTTAKLGKALIAGDSASNNVFKLFSGRADEDAAIPNFYITNNDHLDKEGVKRVYRKKIAGMIEIDQEMEILYSLDYAPFVLAFTVQGNDPRYVDLANRKLIGSTTLGEEMIGGGQSDEDAIYASPYEVEFFVGTAKHQRIRVMFRATKLGYVSVSEYGFPDYRDKGRKLPSKYVASN